MDVLSPELVWVDSNRCYRVNSTGESFQENNTYPSSGGYIEQDLESEEEEEPMDYIVEKIKENSFRTSFHVPSCFHGSIIGQKGSTRKRLEMETKSLIQVPSRGSKQSVVVVTAQREGDVVAARRKIEDIILSSRRRMELTHFTSVPCCHDSIKESFATFKKSILSGISAEGLTEEMFQKPEKLHLTLTGLILLDEEERKLAKEILHAEADNYRSLLSELPSPVEIKIRGLEIMNDDPEATKIVYAKVECPALQIIADQMVEAYAKKRISGRNRDSVKLHMTVINSKFPFVDQEDRSQNPTFNSTKILQEFRDFSFGSFPLTEIHVSQRKAYDDKGFYKATTLIHL